MDNYSKALLIGVLAISTNKTIGEVIEELLKRVETENLAEEEKRKIENCLNITKEERKEFIKNNYENSINIGGKK